jgi:hypothetical protein
MLAKSLFKLPADGEPVPLGGLEVRGLQQDAVEGRRAGRCEADGRDV